MLIFLCAVTFAGFARQQVVVEINGAAVVNGIAKAVFEHGFAGVGGQSQLEEAVLSSEQAVRSLVNNSINMNEAFLA